MNWKKNVCVPPLHLRRSCSFATNRWLAPWGSLHLGKDEGGRVCVYVCVRVCMNVFYPLIWIYVCVSEKGKKSITRLVILRKFMFLPSWERRLDVAERLRGEEAKSESCGCILLVVPPLKLELQSRSHGHPLWDLHLCVGHTQHSTTFARLGTSWMARIVGMYCRRPSNCLVFDSQKSLILVEWLF